MQMSKRRFQVQWDPGLHHVIFFFPPFPFPLCLFLSIQDPCLSLAPGEEWQCLFEEFWKKIRAYSALRSPFPRWNLLICYMKYICNVFTIFMMRDPFCRTWIFLGFIQCPLCLWCAQRITIVPRFGEIKYDFQHILYFAGFGNFKASASSCIFVCDFYTAVSWGHYPL